MSDTISLDQYLKQIKKAVKKSKKKQREIAEGVGMSRPFIAQILSGRSKLPAEKIQPFMDFLGVPPDDILRDLVLIEHACTKLTPEQAMRLRALTAYLYVQTDPDHPDAGEDAQIIAVEG